MCLDFESDQNHEPYRADNQNGMNSPELSTPDFCHGLDYLNHKSVQVTNERNETLDDILKDTFSKMEKIK